MSETPPAAATCAHVMLDLDATSPALVIEQLAGTFGAIPGVPAARALAAAVLEREAQASTYLGHSTALPHARLTSLQRLAVAFARLRQPILWTPEGDLVQFVFLGVVPAAQPRHYLEFMRSLGRTLHDDDNVAILRSLPDAVAVRAWLSKHLALQ